MADTQPGYEDLIVVGSLNYEDGTSLDVYEGQLAWGRVTLAGAAGGIALLNFDEGMLTAFPTNDEARYGEPWREPVDGGTHYFLSGKVKEYGRFRIGGRIVLDIYSGIRWEDGKEQEVWDHVTYVMA